MVVHVNNSLSGRCFFLASRLTIVSLGITCSFCIMLYEPSDVIVLLELYTDTCLATLAANLYLLLLQIPGILCVYLYVRVYLLFVYMYMFVCVMCVLRSLRVCLCVCCICTCVVHLCV